MPPNPQRKPKLRQRTEAALAWVRRKIPPGLRLVIGILLIVGGIFGFLPVLGFWMIPLGAAIVAMDLRLIRDGIERFRDKDPDA